MKQFIPLVELPENYEAYLYLVVFQHNKLMKYYLGWHKGLFDGTYKGSPKAHEEEFMKDLGKYDYEIYAIAVGKAEKIIFMEKIMLNALKKENPQPKDYPILPSSDWKEYYNEATGGGTDLQNCSTGVEDIQNAVDTEDWNTLTRVKVDKKEVYSWIPYQVRPQWLIESHVADIKVGMKVTASDQYFNKNNQLVWDVDYTNGIIWLSPCQGVANYNSVFSVSNFPFVANTVAPTNSSYTTVPSVTFHDEDQLAQNAQRWNAGPHMNEESDTLKNFKGTESSGDSSDDEITSLNGNRYGLDTQRAQGNGTFYIDQDKGTMRFSSNLVGKTIVIDYISDSVGQKRDQIVHKFAEEAMYKWIAHAILATRSNTPEYLVARFKKERFAEMRKAKLRLQNINFKEFTQILRGKSKQIKH